MEEHGTPEEPKPHLNIHKTFAVGGCPDCVRNKGTRCFICRKEGGLAPIMPTKDSERKDSGTEDAMQVDDPDKVGETEGQRKAPSPALDMSPSPPLLFRCNKCRRAAHYRCIGDEEEVAKWQDEKKTRVTKELNA